MTADLSIAQIREAFADHSPWTHPRREGRRMRAATALVLHEPSGGAPEILFIERTEREGDRWSGHMALPGGRAEPGETLIDASRRETHEEVGVALGEPFGRVADSRGAPAVVATYLYEVTERPELRLDTREVQTALWVPLPSLLDPGNAVRFHYRGPFTFGAVAIEHHLIWGLTRGILASFLKPLGLRLPRTPIVPDRRW